MQEGKHGIGHWIFCRFVVEATNRILFYTVNRENIILYCELSKPEFCLLTNDFVDSLDSLDSAVVSTFYLATGWLLYLLLAIGTDIYW
jgi:hypothetical protein